MATPARCPGCSHPMPAANRWCTPCNLRMPLALRTRVETAEQSLSVAATEATKWLAQHPHATERDLQVIVLAAQGRENQEIADQLHLSIHTVKDHWRQLSKRWGCRGRAHIVATAFQLGYLNLEVRK